MTVRLPAALPRKCLYCLVVAPPPSLSWLGLVVFRWTKTFLGRTKRYFLGHPEVHQYQIKDDGTDWISASSPEPRLWNIVEDDPTFRRADPDLDARAIWKALRLRLSVLKANREPHVDALPVFAWSERGVCVIGDRGPAENFP